MTVAAVLEAKRLELVVAHRQRNRVGLHVAPGVARGVLRAVDADEGAEAVVGVHAEGVGAASVAAEGDADVEADCRVRARCAAHVPVAQPLGRADRAVAIASLLIPVAAVRLNHAAGLLDNLRHVRVGCLRARGEGVECAVVVATAVRGIEHAWRAPVIHAAEHGGL